MVQQVVNREEKHLVLSQLKEQDIKGKFFLWHIKNDRLFWFGYINGSCQSGVTMIGHSQCTFMVEDMMQWIKDLSYSDTRNLYLCDTFGELIDLYKSLTS